MAHSSLQIGHMSWAATSSFVDKLNHQWHKVGLQIFMAIVLAHWAEHLLQAVQVYVLHWPIPEARGALGLWFPWLVKSELLHYLYALIMLAGLWVFRSGFQGVSYTWWMVAFGIQCWHHVEHALLQGQAIAGVNLFGSPVPVSIAQLWIRRVELHLLYNALVFIPMVVAMYFHMFPPKGEQPSLGCSCAWHREALETNAA